MIGVVIMLLVAGLLEVGLHDSLGIVIRAFEAHQPSGPKTDQLVAAGFGAELHVGVMREFVFEGVFAIVEGGHFAQQSSVHPANVGASAVYRPPARERNLTSVAWTSCPQ